MPRLGPIIRRQLISFLRQLGFSGPYSGGRHEFLVRGELKRYVQNPHEGDIGRDLLVRILQQAGIERRDWESLVLRPAHTNVPLDVMPRGAFSFSSS